MTSTIFNVSRVFAFALVLSVLVVPVSVHAKGGEKSGRDDSKDRSSSSRSMSDDSSSSNSSKSKNKSGNFCSSLDSVSADIMKSLPKCDQVLLASTSAPFIPAPVDKRAEKLITLGERAKSPEKVRSVKEYKDSVEVEFERHRKLVESAQFEFRTAADRALDTQRASFAQACRGLASTTRQALTNAKTSCLNNKDESTIRGSLKKSLQSSQETFVKSTAGVSVVQERVKKLRETRDSKVSTSLEKLNKSTSASLNKLKSVLNK